MVKPSGWYTDRRGVRYVHVPMGSGKRKDARLAMCATDEAAAARAAIVRDLAKALRAAGKDEYLATVVDEAAAADDARLASIRRVVAGIVKGVERPAAAPLMGDTWRDVARRWTGGELHKLYPDQVPTKRSVDMDLSRVAVLEELVGDVLISEFRIDHAEDAMRRLPDRVQTSATRRQYAQCLRRVLELAVYPLRLIPANPLPRGFLPKVTQTRALQMPYPDEDAALLGCPGVPLVHRLAYGFLARMGFRKSEIIGGAGDEEDDADEREPVPPLTWDRVDLARGVVFRRRSKTDKPVPIPLDASVARALARWKELRPPTTPDAPVFAGGGGEPIALDAGDFREHLKLAGVVRPELHTRSKDNAQVRVHDLRALFVTTSLAAGRSDTWVRDRTSHRTVSMLDKYRRQARLLEELDLGTLRPLDEAIPELAPTFGGASDDGPKRPETSRTVAIPPRETVVSVPLATARQTFGSSYEGSNPSVGTSTYENDPATSVGSSGGSGGDVVDEALEEKLDRARGQRRWADVAKLAAELEARAEERRRRDARELAGVVEIRRERR